MTRNLHPPSAPLTSFLAPRYWLTWLFVLWMRLTAVLPWRLAVKLHKGLGRVAGLALPGIRRVVRRNLEICFPRLEPRAVDALMGQHFACIGAFLAETAKAWFGSSEQIAALFRVEGIEHLHAALAKGKGVMLYSGHFTPLELCVGAIKPLVPLFAFMYRARNNPLLDAMQSRCRVHAAHTSIRNDDVRGMVRMLKKNAVVWYAPDQVPAEGGVLLPFFDEPAMTSISTSRLARISGAAVVPLFYARLPDDSGYVLRFEPALEGIGGADPLADTARLTAVLEDFVRECPEQYFWTHRKFKRRPADLPDAYER